MDKKAKQTSSIIIILCWAAYTAAYIGRLNFNAYIEPIRDQIGATKTEMGLVSSFFFFSYGAGQLIHGILSRKYNTRYSVAIALIGSALVNVGMTLCPGVSSMKYVWLLGGVFQSILWSSIIKTLSDRLPDEMLSKAVVVMSTTAALGTFLSYGLASLFSAFKVDYRMIFFVPAKGRPLCQNRRRACLCAETETAARPYAGVRVHLAVSGVCRNFQRLHQRRRDDLDAVDPQGKLRDAGIVVDFYHGAAAADRDLRRDPFRNAV